MGERAPRKLIRAVASLSAGVLASATLAACGGSDGGVPVINLYGSASAAGFDKVTRRRATRQPRASTRSSAT